MVGYIAESYHVLNILFILVFRKPGVSGSDRFGIAFGCVLGISDHRNRIFVFARKAFFGSFGIHFLFGQPGFAVDQIVAATALVLDVLSFVRGIHIVIKDKTVFACIHAVLITLGNFGIRKNATVKCNASDAASEKIRIKIIQVAAEKNGIVRCGGERKYTNAAVLAFFRAGC